MRFVTVQTKSRYLQCLAGVEPQKPIEKSIVVAHDNGLNQLISLYIASKWSVTGKTKVVADDVSVEQHKVPKQCAAGVLHPADIGVSIAVCIPYSRWGNKSICTKWKC